jgi:hypothetical protein
VRDMTENACLTKVKNMTNLSTVAYTPRRKFLNARQTFNSCTVAYTPTRKVLYTRQTFYRCFNYTPTPDVLRKRMEQTKAGTACGRAHLPATAEGTQDACLEVAFRIKKGDKNGRFS